MKAQELKLIQLDLEKEMHDGGVQRWRDRNNAAISVGDAASTDWNIKLTKNFIEPLSRALRTWVDEANCKTGRRSRVVYYMNLVPAEEAAFITIRSMLNSIALRESTSLQALSIDIASKIEDQVRFSTHIIGSGEDKHRRKKYLKMIDESLKKSKSKSYRHKRNVWTAAERKLTEDKWSSWAKDEKLQLGVFLIKMACEMVVLFNEETEELDPLFYVDEIDIGRGKTRKTSKILGMTARYVHWVSEFVSNTEAFHPEIGACVIPPRDWVNPFKGGFHTANIASRNPLIKMRDKELAKQMTVSQMPKVYKAINALQRTEWKVNTEVLDILQEVCEKRLPLAVPDLDEADEPVNPIKDFEDVADLRGEQLKKALTSEEYDAFISWKRKKKDWHDEERSRKSNVIDLSSTRKIAEKYSIFEKIYFVYSLDFRGRVYTRASGLNPQGRDLQKGLLRFANRKPLGKHGHYWFKIHGANLWGFDKASFNDRISEMEKSEFISMCKAIAADPIKNKYWVKADKPWQFLAWCFEFADFQSHMEDCNDPATFETFIACAMDGSCSGIQHYSAMLRDEVGGAAVNLTNIATAQDVPNDIYGEVCNVVLKKVKKDARIPKKGASEERIAKYNFATQWLELGFDRNLPKKSVMTLPYGSSKITCNDSVGEYVDGLQKKENKIARAEMRVPKLVHSFGERRYEAERYMSDILWDSIGEVVVAARDGMSFIKAVARAVALENEALIWTAPSGFIIKQEIFKTEKHMVNTVLQGRIQFAVYDETNEICSRKMQSGSAPNFIHGNDGSHLVLAVCDMVDKGITDIWVVHDDYGTHAGQTGELHISLRVTMVDMYEGCLLQDFKEEQELHCSMEIDVEVPEYGELDLKSILTSKYIFS